MNAFFEDLLYCLKISLYVFLGSFIAGNIVGVIIYGFNFVEIMLWGCRVVQYVAVLGLALAGLSFTKQDLLRPLHHHKEWNLYFYKFNLAFVIFFISVFIAIISYSIETAIKF